VEWPSCPEQVNDHLPAQRPAGEWRAPSVRLARDRGIFALRGGSSFCAHFSGWWPGQLPLSVTGLSRCYHLIKQYSRPRGRLRGLADCARSPGDLAAAGPGLSSFDAPRATRPRRGPARAVRTVTGQPPGGPRAEVMVSCYIHLLYVLARGHEDARCSVRQVRSGQVYYSAEV